MEYDTSFLKRQDNQIDVFPVIAGRPLEDVIREKMMCPDSENLHCTSGYFSWLDYDTEIGIIGSLADSHFSCQYSMLILSPLKKLKILQIVLPKTKVPKSPV